MNENNNKAKIIFQSDEFNNLDIYEFKDKFTGCDNFKELLNLKEIVTDLIMGRSRLTKHMLDPRGNKYDGWSSGEKRGGKSYDPPIGWIGIGLKVLDLYDNNNNEWIGHNNSPGEWCVAYHGFGRGQSSDQVKFITGTIYRGGFKPGNYQMHADCSDIYHPGKKVGNGIACTPSIKCAEEYAGISEINGIKYITVLMVRVKPSAIRSCNCFNKDYVYWFVAKEEIRPYRILYKKMD